VTHRTDAAFPPTIKPSKISLVYLNLGRQPTTSGTICEKEEEKDEDEEEID
jgi:hypothetical protein